MKYTPKIEKAIKTAASAHDGQYRKAYRDPRLPYMSHLYSVAVILSSYTEDEDIIVAGLLHDILEDTDYKREKLLTEFGSRIHDLVFSVTEATKEEKERINWREEKENYLNKLKEGGFEASLIASADKIHNLLSSIETRIMVSKNLDQQKWFHEEVFKVIKEKLGNHPIVSLHKETMRLAGEVFGEDD